MQSPLFEPTNLPTIEPPSPIAHAVFEEPMLLLIGIGVLGLILVIAMLSRAKGKAALWSALVCTILSGGIFFASTMVTTDREVIADHAEQLIQSVAKGSELEMQRLMMPSVRVESNFVSAEGRDRVISMAVSRVPNRVDSAGVREIQVDLPGPRVGRSMVKIRTAMSGSASLSSWWMIRWEREDAQSSEWKASHIEPLWIQGLGS